MFFSNYTGAAPSEGRQQKIPKRREMRKMSLGERKTLLVILLAVLIVAQYSVAVVSASPTNAIQNAGFEYTTDWDAIYSTIQGSYAQVRDTSQAHGGSASGLTKTQYPKQEFCSAALRQSLDIPVKNLSTFHYWIRKGDDAQYGYYHAQARITLTGNYKLSYYHEFDGSDPPEDGTFYKYIEISNRITRPNRWAYISRNLISDLVDKFGTSVLDRNVTAIELISRGTKNLETGATYGQIVNWDDIYMECDPADMSITLTSETFDGQTNVGKIRFDNIFYQVLPATVEKHPEIYPATAIPPHGGYFFAYWEVYGSASVSDVYSQTTSVTLWGPSTLKAVFTPYEHAWTFMVYIGGDNNLAVGNWHHNVTNQLEMIGSTDHVAVFAMLDNSDTDGEPALDGQEIEWKYSDYHYYITQDTDPNNISSDPIWSDSEINSGDPDTLFDFVNRSVHHSPAQHYALILMDHGLGVEGVIRDHILPTAGGRQVYSSAGDYIEMPELREALERIEDESEVTVGLLGFHACIMGEVEVAYQTMNLTEVSVASEDLQYVESWPYEWILGNLTANPFKNSEELGELIVDCAGNFAETHMDEETYTYGTDMTAVNVSKTDSVAKSVSDLGGWLKDNLGTYRSEIEWARAHIKEYEYEGDGLDYVDAFNMTQVLAQSISDTTLQSLCQFVQQNITAAVISRWFRSDAADSHGLSLFFPDQPGDYLDCYREPLLNMSTLYCWDDFLEAYLEIES